MKGFLSDPERIPIGDRIDDDDGIAALISSTCGNDTCVLLLIHFKPIKIKCLVATEQVNFYRLVRDVNELHFDTGSVKTENLSVG